MTLPAGWLLELLSGSGAPIVRTKMPEVDLTPEEVGAALQRSPVTVRAYCSAGLFPGAYRLRARQWRVPVTALAAFQAAERKAHEDGKRAPACRR
jgi:helix-turn-helix protein